MIDFFSDLDNTFVYSHRVSLPGQRVAVEYLNNRVQSYMTQKSFNFLATQDKIRLIPVTTRTCEQYARLSETFTGFGCQYALVCNGGILLHNNKVDPQWIAETRLIAEDGASWLLEAEKFIRLELCVQNIHGAEGIMIYARVDDPPLAASRLSQAFKGSKLTIYFDSRKVYCIPSAINKGTALKRFSAREGIFWSVAAGDSIPDLPMLEAADEAIVPSGLSHMVMNPRKRVFRGSHCFSDFICDELSDLLPMGT